MTLLGRVFTGLIFCLSIVFFFTALIVNATHVSWYDAVMKEGTGYRAKNRALQDQIGNLNQQIERLKLDLTREQFTRRMVLGALQTQLAQLNSELASKEEDLRKKTEENTIAIQTLNSTNNELKRITDDNTAKTQRIAEIVKQRDDALQQVIDLSDTKFNFESQLTDLQRVNAQLREQNTIVQAQLSNARDRLRVSGILEDPDDAPPRGVNGIVQALDNSGLVEISLGADDGLRRGHELDVVRGGTLVGRIQVQTVLDDKSIGKFTIRRVAPQVNDRVVAKAGM